MNKVKTAAITIALLFTVYILGIAVTNSKPIYWSSNSMIPVPGTVGEFEPASDPDVEAEYSNQTDQLKLTVKNGRFTSDYHLVSIRSENANFTLTKIDRPNGNKTINSSIWAVPNEQEADKGLMVIPIPEGTTILVETRGDARMDEIGKISIETATSKWNKTVEIRDN